MTSPQGRALGYRMHTSRFEVRPVRPLAARPRRGRKAYRMTSCFDVPGAPVGMTRPRSAGSPRAGVHPWLRMLPQPFRRAPGAPVGPGHAAAPPQIRHPREGGGPSSRSREGGGPSMAPDAAATGGEQGEPPAAAAKTKAGPRLGGRGDGREHAIQSQRKQMCESRRRPWRGAGPPTPPPPGRRTRDGADHDIA